MRPPLISLKNSVVDIVQPGSMSLFRGFKRSPLVVKSCCPVTILDTFLNRKHLQGWFHSSWSLACNDTILIADTPSHSRAPVSFPAQDIRSHVGGAVSAISRGTDPRFPHWSLGSPGFDDAARAISLFGWAPVRLVKVTVSTQTCLSSIPDQEVISEMRGAAVKVKIVQRCDEATQTSLCAFRSPTEGFYIARPLRRPGSHDSQKIRNNLRLTYYNFFCRYQEELARFSSLNPELSTVYSLPFYEKKPSRRRKFHSNQHFQNLNYFVQAQSSCLKPPGMTPVLLSQTSSSWRTSLPSPMSWRITIYKCSAQWRPLMVSPFTFKLSKFARSNPAKLYFWLYSEFT